MSEPIAEEPVFALTNSADEMVSLGRLTQRTTPGTVAQVIRKAILAGQLKPGSQLREIPLAADLGVSRAPLREALGLLAEEGLAGAVDVGLVLVAAIRLLDEDGADAVLVNDPRWLETSRQKR